MQHCCELVLPIGLTSPLDFTKDYNVARKQSRNRVENGSSSSSFYTDEKQNKLLRKRTIDACMLYNDSLQSRDEGKRSHQAVIDFNKPRWAYVNSVFGKGLSQVEFHRSCIPADADLLTVKNVYKQEGHITGGGLPFTLYMEGEDILFMPRPEPIHLGTPWGATFFGVLSGLPTWVITKLMLGKR